MLEPITLSVGQIHHLKRGKDRIVYAGMPSEGSYSLVQLKNAGMSNVISWNLFFSKSQSNIAVDAVNIDVENVTPEEIRLRVG